MPNKEALSLPDKVTCDGKRGGGELSCGSVARGVCEGALVCWVWGDECGGDECGGHGCGGDAGGVGKRAARASRASERYRGRFPTALAFGRTEIKDGVPHWRSRYRRGGGGGPRRAAGARCRGQREGARGGGERRAREVDKWRRRGIVA